MTDDHRSTFDDRAFQEWAAECRRLAAVHSRDRINAWRELAPTDWTSSGTLIELADRGVPVLVVLGGGRRLRATIGAIGGPPDDLWAMLRSESTTLVRLRWIVSVTVEEGSSAIVSSGAVPVPAATTPTAAFATAVLSLIEPGDGITARSGGMTTAGTVVAAGADLLVLAHERGGACYLLLDAVDEVTLSAPSTYR